MNRITKGALFIPSIIVVIAGAACARSSTATTASAPQPRAANPSPPAALAPPNAIVSQRQPMRNIQPGNASDFVPLVAATDSGAYCRQLPGIGGLNLRSFAFGKGDGMTRTIIVSLDDQGSPSMYADQRGDLRAPFNVQPGAKPLGPRTAVSVNFAQNFAILENRSDKGEEAMRVAVTDVIDNEKFGNPRKWIAQVLKDCL